MKKFFKSMKAKTKKFFAVCALALILAVAVGYGVQTSMSNNNTEFSALMLANVEALAKWEAPKDPPSNSFPCYVSIDPAGGSSTICCASCVRIPGRREWDSSMGECPRN